MKRFISFKVFIFSSLVLSNDIQYIPFDLGYQFGYLSHNGMIKWGEDWKSKDLLFDGTWAIFPPMYGGNIKKGFENNLNNEISSDSSDVVSKIEYHQGDYGFDQFSIQVDYIEENRNLKLFGFKRSFVGNFNQYYLNTLQPQQQSYTLSIKSFENGVKTGLSVGHFNTLSGFPDQEINGLFDNRITSLNYFWEKMSSFYSINFTMDQFLQRYKAVHSLSFYEYSRYLNRSFYKVEAKSLINQFPILVGFSKNNRSTVLDSKVNIGWFNLYSNLQYKGFNLSTSVIQDQNQLFYDYSIIFEKKIRFVNINILNKTRSDPFHPYYLHNAKDSQNTNFYKRYFNHGSVSWNSLNSRLCLMISVIEDKQKFDMEALSMQNKYSNIKLIFTRKINSGLDALIHYNITDTKNYYSGGIGNEIGLKVQSDFSLLNNFLKLEIESEIRHFFNRVNYSMINPIEMVPMIISENDHGKLMPINLINLALRANVSSVIFQFRWMNLSEIILSSIQSDKNNFFSFHPSIPDMGRQIDFSINWEFQN